MYLKLKNPASLWKWLYILINVSALLWMLASGEMMGDTQGLAVQRPERLVLACVVVVAGYWFLLGPFFKMISRIPVERIRFGPHLGLVHDRLGIFIVVAQLAFLAFNVLFGVNVAGSGNARTESSLGLIWVFLPVD
jgi:hypothetical protein